MRAHMTAAAGRTAYAGPAGSPRSSAVMVAGLRKSYGAVRAVRGTSFAVSRGEIFALLGPNGAGKTTTLEILEGFRSRDAGMVEVLGLDPGDRSHGRALRERIGLVLQDIAVEPYLTVRETIARNAGYYPEPRDVDEVIALVGLAGQTRQKVRALSGGQKRRLDLALGLIGAPELLFLDEPTTGFDPNARRDAWQLVRSLRDEGTTIVLTTHYMEEAQALADRVAVISEGQIVAEGTPASIGGRDTARARIRFALPAGYTAADLPADAVPAGGLVTVETAEPTRALHQLTGWALRHGTVLGQAHRRPAQPGGRLPAADRPRRTRAHDGKEYAVTLVSHQAPRRDLAMLWHQIRYEQLSFWRNPQSAFFTFVFPVVIITIFGALFRGASGSSYFYGLSALQYYVPTIAAISVLGACYSQLAIVLSTRRQNGILKRVRATPLPAGTYFLGLLAHCIMISAVDVALITGIGAAFGTPLPTHWPAIALALVLGAASFCALGVAVASLIRNSEAAPAVVQLVLFPLVFLSGSYMPIHSDLLNRISGALPVRPFNQALMGPFAQHTGFDWKNLGVLLAWGAAGTLIAVRRFRWDPRPE